MATINSGFLKATLGGAAALMAVPAASVSGVQSALAATRLDYVLADLTKNGYALNGAVRVALSGTTPVTIDLTNLTTGAQSYAGDTTFAKWQSLTLYNDGAAAVTVGSGASNGATLPWASTFTLAPSDKIPVPVATAVTVDSTHKNITITPTSGGSFVLVVGGQ